MLKILGRTIPIRMKRRYKGDGDTLSVEFSRKDCKSVLELLGIEYSDITTIKEYGRIYCHLTKLYILIDEKYVEHSAVNLIERLLKAGVEVLEVMVLKAEMDFKCTTPYSPERYDVFAGTFAVGNQIEIAIKMTVDIETLDEDTRRYIGELENYYENIVVLGGHIFICDIDEVAERFKHVITYLRLRNIVYETMALEIPASLHLKLKNKNIFPLDMIEVNKEIESYIIDEGDEVW